MGNAVSCISGERSRSVSQAASQAAEPAADPRRPAGSSADFAAGASTGFTATAGTSRARMHPSHEALSRKRSSIDSAMDTASLLYCAPGLDETVCYSVLDGYYAPSHKGAGYLAYSMESDLGYADWLLVPDDSHAPSLTPSTLCQLMLVMQGKRRDEGLGFLKRYDIVGAPPLPANALQPVSWADQFKAIRETLDEHASIVLQGDEKALMISLAGVGHEHGPDGITVMDPSTGQCLAVFSTALADVIQQHLQPSTDYLVHYLPRSSGMNIGYLEDE